MVSEFKVNEIRNWLDRTIKSNEELIAKYGDEDVSYLKGHLDALKYCKRHLFDGGLYDLEG